MSDFAACGIDTCAYLDAYSALPTHVSHGAERSLSQSSQHANHRQIRRAFGPDALDAITARDQQIRLALERCNALADEIIGLRRDLRLCTDRQRAQEAELSQAIGGVTVNDTHIMDLAKMCGPLLRPTLWGRLRALVTGH